MSTEATVFFPTLLSVLKVGAHTLRNRTLMGSLHTRMESLDRSIDRLSLFYAERARGGNGCRCSRLAFGRPHEPSREERPHGTQRTRH